MKKISESSFTIAYNGATDGPAQPLRDYLLSKGAKQVITIAHPLAPENDNKHIITFYEGGKVRRREVRLPHKPPLTYIFDPFVPFRLPKTTAWIGFNNLASLRGLVRRSYGRTDKVIYWAVDFVSDRFGKGVATKGYNMVDKWACRKVDSRVELSPVGITSRNKYLGLNKKDIAPTYVVPMGAWLDRTPKVSNTAWKKHKIVYLGHLIERQGVKTLVEAISILSKRGVKVSAEVVGSGPLENDLRQLAKELQVDKLVKFHGFVKDHKDVESILASGTIAAAPYMKDDTSFVQFTDAGKLKAYLGANLPIVLTDVPNNAQYLRKAGAALIADDSSKTFADALEVWLTDEKLWKKAHQAAASVALDFDWNHLLKTALHNFGFEE